jgi:hypothetical protein
MNGDANPFAVLSLIVAPAILTNAASVLAMSTSNRLARAVDRARALSNQLEESPDCSTPVCVRQLHELTVAEERAVLLLKALRSIYVALGGLASTALLSLLGAISFPLGIRLLAPGMEMTAVLVGLVAIGALLNGSLVLIRETRLAVRILQERADQVRRRARPGG